jgi:hypothetical protein
LTPLRCRIDECADVLVGLVEGELHIAARGTGSVTEGRQAEGEIEVRHLGEVDGLRKIGVAAVVVGKVADELGTAIFLPVGVAVHLFGRGSGFLRGWRGCVGGGAQTNHKRSDDCEECALRALTGLLDERVVRKHG